MVVFDCCGGRNFLAREIPRGGVCVVCEAVTNPKAWHTANHSIFRLHIVR